jgi:AcrR family transcriptional regulator
MDEKIDGRRERSKETRAAIIEAAIRITAARGAHALTISDVAREAKINRTTAYQFFKGRDELLEAVRAHIAEEMLGPLTAFANIDQMTKYVAKNREAMRSWAARLLVGQGLTDDSWVWDRLLESIREITTRRPVREEVDREALATILLVAGVIGPLVFESAVPNPGEPGLMARYARELERVLNGGIWGAEVESTSTPVEEEH